MPRHKHFVDAYFGGGSVLLACDPMDPNRSTDGKGISEVANDISGTLTNFWRVLQGPCFPEFQRTLSVTPFSRNEWNKARYHIKTGDPIQDAVAFFVRCRQSLSGRQDSFSSIVRTRTRRSMNDNVSGWLSAVEGLPEVHARLQRVLVENRPALDIIRSEDANDTLFYLDPTYPSETRTSKDVYEHEMSDNDHYELLGTITECTGKVMISSYNIPGLPVSDTYRAKLSNWNRHDKEIHNHASGSKKKPVMTEVLWCNF